MKKFFILSIFIFFILISSVSANEINNTDSDDYLTSNILDESIEVVNNPEDINELSENPIDENKLNYQSTNESLSSSDLIVNSDFEEGTNGWTFSGSAEVVDDPVGQYGSSAHFVASNDRIYQSIDWTNIESFSYRYYVPSSAIAMMNVYINDDSSYSGTNDAVSSVTPASTKGSWQDSGEIDTSGLSGVSNLIFYAPTLMNGGIYVDSITFTAKQPSIESYNINTYVDTPIYFNYTTTDTIDSWYWDFGNGKHSIDSSPIYIYNQSGVYDANLTINNGVESKVIYYTVNVIDKLIADFEYDFDGSLIKVRDKSLGNIKSWVFDFGTGKNYSYTGSLDDIMGYNVVINYPSNTYGTRFISLTVTDKFGNTDNITKNIGNSYISKPYTKDVDSFEDGADDWNLYENVIISDEMSLEGNNSIMAISESYDLFSIMEKEVNFDDVDFIEFYARTIQSASVSGMRIYMYIDDIKLDGDISITHWASWYGGSFNTQSLSGIHKVILKASGAIGSLWIDNINYKNYNNIANFSIAYSNAVDGKVAVSFTDTSFGKISGYYWEFDDGTNSTQRNPVHNFTQGTHSVTLHIYRDGLEVDRYSYIFTLSLPTINSTGISYNTIQEAVNNANENDVINIASGMLFNENICIDKSLTLDINGAIITPKDITLPLFNVTNGATVTVTNLGLNKDSTFVTDSDSKLIIKDSDIGVNLGLSEGNVDLLDNSFNNSVLTLVANITIANSTITKGGVIVNGGKSKIFNTTLTGLDIAVTQTAGELDIISNVITDNNIGVNVVGGKTNMEYNLIYANAKFGLVYVGDNVSNSNNWWGSEIPTIFNGENLSDTYYDIYRLEDVGAELDSWLTLKFTTTEQVMGTNKEYQVNIETLTDNNEKINGYLKTIDLQITSLGNNYDATLEMGIGEFTIISLTEVNNIILTVLGNDYVLDVPVMAKTNVLIGVDGEAVVDGSVVVNVEVPYATGSVTFYVDDDTQTVELNNTNASYTISNLTAGKHNIFVVYGGNDIFNSIYNATTIDVPESVDYNKTISELQTQLSEAKNNATQLNKNLTDANQRADNLTAQLSEAQKTIQNLSADLISTTIVGKDLTIKALDSGNIQVTLKDANNKLLANKDVQVIINGVTYKGTTNNDGVAIINVKFASAGTYNAVVSFMGDNTYKSSIATSKVIVNKKATALTAKKATLKVKKAKKIKVTLKSEGKVVAGKTITIKVNGKTFKAKTNSKGVATVKVKVAKKGKFTATVKFAGDSAYKAVTKKVKFNVKK